MAATKGIAGYAGPGRAARLLKARCSPLVLLLLCLAMGRPAVAQVAALFPGQNANSQTAVPSYDPLGRETPRGAILGFIRAAQAENYAAATQYFQEAGGRHRPSREQDQELAGELLTILNQRFGPILDSLSRDPQGQLDDGLPADQEKIGVGRGQADIFPILLLRVDDQHGNKIWVISRQTLDQVPRFYDSLRYPRLEKNLPKALVAYRPLAVPLWQWLAILLFVPIAIFLSWLLVVIAKIAIRLFRRARGLPPFPSAPRTKVGAGVLLLAVVIHYNFVYFIGASLLYRQYYTRVVWILFLAGFYWAVTRITSWAAHRIGIRLMNRGRIAERSLISLARRVLDATIFILVGLIVLSSLGVNVTAALAGLGIGGLAIGLGAQKTFENLLGGISILTDRALQIGDPCRIGDQRGTVEDIGLRSTKIRTEDRTLVSIPNGAVATSTLENYRLRDKILSRQVVRLRYDLSRDHVAYVLGHLRDVLARHPRIEQPTARVRVLRFAEYAIEVEIYFYVLDREYAEFLAVQEEILLRIMATLESTGAVVALPSQATIVRQDSWVNPDKARAAHEAAGKTPQVPPGTDAGGRELP